MWTALKNKKIVAGLAGQTLIRGTAKKNRQQIQDEIDRLKAQINVGGSATGASVIHRNHARESCRRHCAWRVKFSRKPPSRRRSSNRSARQC